MKVVLLEGLGVSEQVIEQHARKLESMGHTFVAYPKNTDPLVQAEWSRDADVIMLANMPLAPVVLEEAKNLKFIDVAFTGVDHIPMAEAKQRGIAVSNASGYATQAVAELCVSFMIQLLRNVGKTEERCRNGAPRTAWWATCCAGRPWASWVPVPSARRWLPSARPSAALCWPTTEAPSPTPPSMSRCLWRNC